MTSDILKQKQTDHQVERDQEYGIIYLFRRMGRINQTEWKRYVFGACFAACTGAVYPAFGVVYGHVINGLSSTDRHELRTAGNRNALWYVRVS